MNKTENSENLTRTLSYGGAWMIILRFLEKNIEFYKADHPGALLVALRFLV